MSDKTKCFYVHLGESNDRQGGRWRVTFSNATSPFWLGMKLNFVEMLIVEDKTITDTNREEE